jgi:hypothetical protein
MKYRGAIVAFTPLLELDAVNFTSMRKKSKEFLHHDRSFRNIERTEESGITFFEQPIHHDYLAGMAKIRAAVDVPSQPMKGASPA